MERLAYWLCAAGLASLGTAGGSAGAETAEPCDAYGSEPAAPPSAKRIRYPLRVDDWQAVGEHLFEEQEYGMSVRYAHGRDRDRWIDIYIYPAGAMTATEFAAAAAEEADMIREAHDLAGYEESDIGSLRDFSFPAWRDPARNTVEGLALDLAYAVDGTEYSSAMTLLLEREYFVKGRFSIERNTLSREAAREQLLAFTAQLQPRLSILDCDGRPPNARYIPAGLREIRLELHAAPQRPALQAICEDADAG